MSHPTAAWLLVDFDTRTGRVSNPRIYSEPAPTLMNLRKRHLQVETATGPDYSTARESLLRQLAHGVQFYEWLFRLPNGKYLAASVGRRRKR